MSRRRLWGAAAALAVAFGGQALRADEGWVIERLDVALSIQADGSIVARDAIDVDFRGIESHGILRDYRYRFDSGPTTWRDYGIDVGAVTAADGRRHEVEESTVEALHRVRIGDPDRTLAGRETYRIDYRIRHALNGFAGHDELYWNVTGTWPVRIERSSIVVAAPAGAIERAACYQGREGSSEACRSTFTPDAATFAATRPLLAGEQITLVVALRKGVVPEPVALVTPKPRDITRFFDRTPGLVAGTSVELGLVVGALGFLWWRVGRDRRYVSLHHLSGSRDEEPVPLFGDRPIAVEFEPPEGLRPAQIGLLIDERADTLDVTATIVDLAVRRHLSITELPKSWFLGSTDWVLRKLDGPADALLPYEQIVLSGLFDGARERKVSELRRRFHDDLEKARRALYADAVERGWFPRNPNTVRNVARVLGLAAIVGGLLLTIWLGRSWGAGLLGLPVLAGGTLLWACARAMPRRSAAGRALMRRTLGFARYLRTAEASQQAFAERANLFTEYLPYAVAFKCVDRWAKAFGDLDVRSATAAWYAGASGFDARGFSSGIGRLSSTVSSAITSTPGSSGGSGFSGGSSGGGGGGGGGGRW